MKSIAVDASVWVAAQDPADSFCAPSRLFFKRALAAAVLIHVPAFARVEAACVLARKLRNSLQGERLASLLFKATGVREYPVNATLLAMASSLGTTQFLRGADALYSATAVMVACDLVSWDKEHLQRAGALTPDGWLITNP